MVQAHNFVSVDVPKTFKEVFREIMSADPLVVDLHKLGPYYYEFARHLMKLTVTEGQSIYRYKIHTFSFRPIELCLHLQVRPSEIYAMNDEDTTSHHQ